MSEKCSIEFDKVSLIYDLNYEGVNSIKEAFLNFVLRRKAPVDRPETLSALDDISIKIEQGERVGIIGLNGSGKSTFLKVASSILKPQRGRVCIHGNVQPLIEIGAGFNPEFSGRENIYLNGAMLGFSPEQIRGHEREIIQFAELEEFIDIPVKYYSSGMSVRLAFTIATMVQPEILLMDEMLSAGDLSFIEKAKRRIEEILNRAKILVIVSHDLNLIASLATRCLVMEKGKVLFDGPTESALAYYRDRTEDKVEKARLAEEERRRLSAEKEAREMQAEEARRRREEEEARERAKPVRAVEVETVGGVSEIEPGGRVDFDVAFELRRECAELFVNLTLYDRFGVQQIHFRNDFQGHRILGAKPGRYRVRISVPGVPLKSDSFRYGARFVTMLDGQQHVVDSERKVLIVKGRKARTTLVPNHWTFEGPAEFTQPEVEGGQS